MDPSAPPAQWSDEKASMGQQAPPPPYTDSAYPAPGAQLAAGYPQPGPGYAQPGPGYPQPGPGYTQPGPGYPQPGPGYPQPGPGYPPEPQAPGPPPQYGGEGYGQYPYPAQPGAIMEQPKGYVTQGTLARPVNDYLGYSIFTLMCCCMPLGIAALIYSISAREANHSGNQMAAERYSRTARILNHLALGLGIGGSVLLICVVFIPSML
ncbi:uncharacterized protein ACBR49_005108 [Aulostomus maculatus]